MILRILFKGVIIFVVIMAVISYLAYLRTGVFWVPTVSNFSLPFLRLDSQPSIEGTKVSFDGRKNPTYKWLENGRWHYGDVPPEGVESELLQKNEVEKSPVKSNK